tara:strand:- start:1119 stop:2027 length:909 start_codon:yes stop_codon:yes gene_type:complete
MSSDLNQHIFGNLMEQGKTRKFFLDHALYSLAAVKMMADHFSSSMPAGDKVKMRKELEEMEESFRLAQKCTLLKEVGLLHDYPIYKLEKIFPNWRENSKMSIFRTDPKDLLEDVNWFLSEKFGSYEFGFEDSSAFLEFSAFWETKNESEMKTKLGILLKTVATVVAEAADRYSRALRDVQDIQEKVLDTPAAELEEYKKKLILTYNAAHETPPAPEPAPVTQEPAAPAPAAPAAPAAAPVTQGPAPAVPPKFTSVFEDSDSDQDGGGHKKTKRKRKSKRRTSKKKKSKRRKSRKSKTRRRRR